jgi:hypothetical protein
LDDDRRTALVRHPSLDPLRYELALVQLHVLLVAVAALPCEDMAG